MNQKTMAYLSLFFVVLVWGTAPLFTLDLYQYYSPSIRVASAEVVLFLAYLVMSCKHLKSFHADYLKIGIPTGCFLALANLSQKIGLLYTTPAKYAFLENLSCISVPFFMYIFIKKKPTISTYVSCIVCLVSTLVLNNVSDGWSHWGIGELLCGLSGILYGVNIAGTGAFAKKLYAPLYLATQSAVSIVIYFTAAFLFQGISFGNSGVPLEPILFSWQPQHMIYLILVALVSSAFCWVIRTNAMKHIEASVVAVIMPFSAVITSVISVILGNDTLNTNIVLGGLLNVLAMFLSAYDDIFKKNNLSA